MLSAIVTSSMEATARRWQDEVAATATMRRRNYTGLSAPDRYLKGYLGELAFQAILERLRLRYEYEPRTDGRPDSGDFKVFVYGAPFSINVKVNYASGRMGRLFMVPDKQARKRLAPCYVAGKFERGRIDFHGIAWGRDVELWEADTVNFPVPTRARPFSDLYPIEAFMEALC